MTQTLEQPLMVLKVAKYPREREFWEVTFIRVRSEAKELTLQTPTGVYTFPIDSVKLGKTVRAIFRAGPPLPGFTNRRMDSKSPPVKGQVLDLRFHYD